VDVVILAGGFGTRLAEETDNKPKPMVEIGGWPILWHIMRHFGEYGLRDFTVCLGYRGDIVKRFFLDYRHLRSDIVVGTREGDVELLHPELEDWRVRLVDTGLATNTGGRLHRIRGLLSDTFLLTYGDGVSTVAVDELLQFHRAHGKLATITAVRPPSRFGGLELDGPSVRVFSEKPQIGEGWINGGFMVLEPGVLEYVDGDDTSLEADTLERVAEAGELMAYRHTGFWQSMDTLRDMRLLQQLWDSGNPPWLTWR
jgi:glucose-1-phosphate cytidylyltransferase